MDKKTIVFYIATLTRGGAERVMVNLANYFDAKGYRVYMVTLEPDEGLYPMSNTIEKIVLEMSGNGSRIRNLISRVTMVRKIIKEHKADALVAFIGKTNLRGILAGLFTRTSVIVSVRSAPSREYGSKLQQFLAKVLFCFADGIVFQTKEAASFFPKYVQKKAKILLNPLSKEYVGVEAMAYEKRREEIVTVGRMDPVKNHALLVDAFALVAAQNPNVHLTIYGDGSCRKQIEEKREEYGLVDRISLPGDTRDILSHIRDAKLFVLSSDFEGMPNAVMEAMACGIPVISTDCPSGGARALVKEGETGLLVPVGKPDAMAEAILRLLNDRTLYDKIAENCHAFSKTLYPERVNGQWLEYIEDLTCRKK